MSDYGPTAKMVAAAAAGATMLVFAEVTLAVLIPIVVGVALVLLGIGIAYRPPAIIGALAILFAVAFSVELPTLTDVEGVIRAALSLFVPTVTMGWAALSCEPGDERSIGPLTRPTAVLVGTSAAMLLAVPIFGFVIGVFLPTVSTRISTMAEISVLLVAVTAIGMSLSRSVPKRAPPKKAEEEPSEEEEE